jgi:hypothetical protein
MRSKRVNAMMIKNLEMEPSIAADIVDVEGTIELMTNALDIFCDHVTSNFEQKIYVPASLDHELEAVITTTILERNPHLKDRFYLTFEREPGDVYEVNIRICKTPLQEHLESMSGSSRWH